MRKIMSKFLRLSIYISLVFPIGKIQAQVATENSAQPQIQAKELKQESSMAEGMKYFLLEEYQKAVDEFRNNLKFYGESPGVNFMLSKSEAALNQNESAILSAQKAVNGDKNNYYYIQNLADIQIKSRLHGDAAQNYKKLIKLKPENSQNYLKLSDLYLLDENPKEALKILSDLEEILGPVNEITEKKQAILIQTNKLKDALKEGQKMAKVDPEYNLQQAKILIDNGKSENAVLLLKDAINQNPNFFEAYNLLSEIYLKSGNKNGALEILQNSIHHESLPVAVKLNALSAYLSLSKDSQSEETIKENLNFVEKIIEKHPENGKTYVFKGDLLVKSKRLAEGREAYLKAVSLEKGIFEAWLAIIELDVKLMDFKAMAQHADKALQYYPNQAYFWYHHGFALKQTKEFDDALVSLEEAYRMSSNNPNLRNHIQASMGEIYGLQNNLSKAEGIFTEILNKDPKNEQVLNAYSLLLANEKKDLDKALKMSDLLIKSYPNQALYLDTRAWVYFQSGQYADALKAIDEAIRLSLKPISMILEHKGDILFKTGDKNSANTFWKNALDLDPTNKKLENKLKEGTL